MLYRHIIEGRLLRVLMVMVKMWCVVMAKRAFFDNFKMVMSNQQYLCALDIYQSKQSSNREQILLLPPLDVAVPASLRVEEK